MDTIILAAGRGTRFGKLTEKMPKSLIPVAGKPILEYTLSSLPSSTKEVFIVIGHLGEQIKNKFGNNFKNKNIKYIEVKELNGTGGAVWAAKNYLKNRFMVLNGDDIYHKDELEKLAKTKTWAAGLAKRIPSSPKYLTFELDKNNRVTGARYPNKEEMKSGILISTGAFVLDPGIFRYKLVKITDKEYGLPQTILKSVNKKQIKGIVMQKWHQINCSQDIQSLNFFGQP